MYSHTLTLTHSHTHSHTHSLTHKHTHTHTHTHSLTHTLTHSPEPGDHSEVDARRAARRGGAGHRLTQRVGPRRPQQQGTPWCTSHLFSVPAIYSLKSCQPSIYSAIYSLACIDGIGARRGGAGHRLTQRVGLRRPQQQGKQGYLAHKKHPLPCDHHRSLGIGLLSFNKTISDFPGARRNITLKIALLYFQ